MSAETPLCQEKELNPFPMRCPLILGLLALLLPLDVLAQRGAESCYPEGICVFEREGRRGMIDMFVENRTERPIVVELEFTDLYNYRSSRSLPHTGVYEAGKTKRALRLSKSSSFETSRRRWRWKWRYAQETRTVCDQDRGTCMETSLDDNEVVYTYKNPTGQALLVELTFNSSENLVLPDHPVQVVVSAVDEVEVARVKIQDLWSRYDYSYRIKVTPVSN